jgi:hypothetical protein
MRRFDALAGEVIFNHGPSSAFTPRIVPTTSQTESIGASNSDAKLRERVRAIAGQSYIAPIATAALD